MPDSARSVATMVSFDDEPLILVDEDDNPIGEADKVDCHRGEGTLHRAFSLFIFNAAGELLMQQRSAEKPLWPGFWSNSCCSHPRVGESLEEATGRRLSEELGLTTELKFLYRFQYQAPFDEHSAENELCSVFVGFSDAQAQVNPTEISATRWISARDLNRELVEHPDYFTPWFKLEWQRLNEEFADAIQPSR